VGSQTRLPDLTEGSFGLATRASCWIGDAPTQGGSFSARPRQASQGSTKRKGPVPRPATAGNSRPFHLDQLYLALSPSAPRTDGPSWHNRQPRRRGNLRGTLLGRKALPFGCVIAPDQAAGTERCDQGGQLRRTAPTDTVTLETLTRAPVTATNGVGLCARTSSHSVGPPS
jgi:hypothetical protein